MTSFTPKSQFLSNQLGFVWDRSNLVDPASLASLVSKPKKFNTLLWQKQLSRSIENVYFALTNYQELFSERYNAKNLEHRSHIYAQVDQLMKSLEQVKSGDKNAPQTGNIRAALVEIGIPEPLAKTLKGESEYRLFLSVFEILGLDPEALRSLLASLNGNPKHIQLDILALTKKLSDTPNRGNFLEFQKTRGTREAQRLEKEGVHKALEFAQKSLYDQIAQFRQESPTIITQIPQDIRDVFLKLTKKIPDQLVSEEKIFLNIYRILESRIDDEQSDFTALISILTEIPKKKNIIEISDLEEASDILCQKIINLRKSITNLLLKVVSTKSQLDTKSTADI